MKGLQSNGDQNGNRLKFLESNRKVKFAIAVIILATSLFAVPETVSAFVNWQATKVVLALVPPGVPVLLEWHLLNAATYAALVGSVITFYLASNVAQKAFTSPPKPGPLPPDLPEGE